MNIKFSTDGVRCRVSRAELDRLLSGRAIALEVPLPRNHLFRANVWPGAIGGWLLESDPTGIWITIPKTELQALADALPSKEGIEQEFEAMDGTVKVVFEVDVRQSKPSQPSKAALPAEPTQESNPTERSEPIPPATPAEQAAPQTHSDGR